MGLKEILEYIKAPARTVVTLLAFCSTFLLFPESFMNWLGLLPFREKYKTSIGAIWLLSICILLIIIMEKGVKYLTRRIKNSLMKKSMIKQLLNLQDYEKDIIRKMYICDAYTTRFDMISGKHTRLSELEIIFQSSKMTYPGPRGEMLFAFTLQPWVTEYLYNIKDY